MSKMNKLAIAAAAAGALAYAPGAFAQVGGGPEQPDDAKTTPQSQGQSSTSGSSMKSGSMEKDGSMGKSGSMQKGGAMKGGSMENSTDMK